MSKEDDALNTGTGEAVDIWLRKRQQEAREAADEVNREADMLRLNDARQKQVDQERAREMAERLSPTLHIDSIISMPEGDILCVVTTENSNDRFVLHVDVTNVIGGIEGNKQVHIQVFRPLTAQRYTIDNPNNDRANRIGGMTLYEDAKKQKMQVYGSVVDDTNELYPFRRAGIILTSAYLALEKLHGRETRDKLPTDMTSYSNTHDNNAEQIRRNYPLSFNTAIMSPDEKRTFMEQTIQQALRPTE